MKNYKTILVVAFLAVLLGISGIYFLWSKNDTPKLSLPGLSIASLFNIKTNENAKAAEENSGGQDFFVAYPDGFEVAEIPQEKGRMIVAEKNSEEGFQIFIMPFDEDVLLTPERIKFDMPELLIKNAQNISVDSVPALAFESYDELLGDTFEVWFIHNGNFYQITTYKNFKGRLTEILKTWKFQQ